MSADAVYLDFEDPALQTAAATTPAVGKKPKKRPEIPVLPASVVPIEEIRGHPTRRTRACVNLRIERVPWPRVVELLEYASVEEARADFLRGIAAMHDVEDAKVLQTVTIANAEQLLARSMAMAAADYLVDVENPDKLIPNRDRLRWHAQASADLSLLASLNGTKLPIRIEVTPTEEEFVRLTAAVLQAHGIAPVIEADVLELEQIPDAPVEDP